MSESKRNQFRRNQWFPLVCLFAGCLFLVVLTLNVTWRQTIFQLTAWFLGTLFISTVFYMTSVRFWSPTVVSENGVVVSSFNNRVEVIHDSGYGIDFGIVFTNGFNSSRNILSAPDISTSGHATMWVTTSPRMIESVGNGRFLLVRGTPYECGPYEARAFLNRPSIKAALGDEVKSARLYFVFTTRTLKPDIIPASTNLGELAALYQHWLGELDESAKQFEEEFQRKFGTIRVFKSPPTTQKLPLPESQEEKKDAR